MRTRAGGIESTLSPSVASAGEARRLVQPLRTIYPDAAVDDVSLLVTELVTNEVRHGAGRSGCPIILRVCPVIAGLRVEVVNPSPADDVRVALRPDPGPNGGFGLRIVDEIASRWGVMIDDALTVWAEVTI